MYIYQVTYLPTREFYIGITEESKAQFNPTKNTDPAGMFNTLGSNGTRLPMLNCEKRILKLAGSKDELIEMGTKIAKQYENNPSFKGLVGLPAPPKPKAEPPKPKVDNSSPKEEPKFKSPGITTKGS